MAGLAAAAVHGHAIGAGFQLALACDIRVAAEALRIGLVNSVVAPDALSAMVDELAAALLRPAAGATRETLALLAAAADGPTLDKQRAAERAAQFRRLSELRAAPGG